MKEQEIQYQAGDVTAKGFLVYDAAVSGKRPGVLVVHEWWGHSEFTRDCARKVAQAGFVGFALDLYGNGKHVDDPQEAARLMGEIGKNFTVLRTRFNAAREVLSKQQNVDASRIAAIGHCFGGNVVLQMARAGEDLRAVVSFHGLLGFGQPAQAGKVKAKVLVLNGADDPLVPKDQLQAFEKEMQAAGVDYQVVNYPGGKHAFTNPAATERGKKYGLPLEYNAALDKQSWDEAVAFLNRVLK
jgi:dienelactone hydrolase